MVDFALFHVEISGKTLNWYVFNLADVAIVAGVMALLYNYFMGTRRKTWSSGHCITWVSDDAQDPAV